MDSPWDPFQADITLLAAALRANYTKEPDQAKQLEVTQALRALGAAAEAFFESLSPANPSPALRSVTSTTSRAFGTALRASFRHAEIEIDQAFHFPPQH